MKKTILLIILLPAFAIAQSGKSNQSIELPDFVITGIQNVHLPVIEKHKPGFISVLSKEFFTPQFSTKNFAPSDIATPKKLELVLIDQKPNSHGKLLLGGGIYTLPKGRLDLDWNFNGGLIGANVWGIKETDYVDFAGNNSSGGAVEAKFFLDNSSKLLPGAEISANAGFTQSTFNFFASPIPDRRRQIMSFSGSLSLERDHLSVFNFGVKLEPEYLRIAEEKFSETNLKAESFLKLKFPGFAVQGSLNLLRQRSTHNGTDTSSFYLSGKGFAHFQPANSISLKGGVFYSSFEGSFYLHPFASAVLQFNDRLSIIAELNSRTDYYSQSNLLGLNRFFDLGSENHLTDVKFDLSGAFKYEYFTYFEIQGGAEYLNADNYLFFEDVNLNGEFSALGQNGAKKLRAFVNLLFNPGPLGYFYGGVEYCSVTGAAGSQLPYEPKFTANIEYGTTFEFGLNLKSGFNLKSEVYADLRNFSKLPVYHNAYLNIEFQLSKKLGIGLELNNLLNNKNFLLYEYREKPFDAVGNIVYSW